MAAQDALKRAVLAPAKRVRQSLVPEYEDLLADAGRARDGIAALQAENRRLQERVEALETRLAQVEEGLHEARRLNLRLAELTDVVTELVLPLHDREIDASKLDRLAPETL
jgi:predicted nuclease with TOPRIM domain